jgi:hypothetical protein
VVGIGKVVAQVAAKEIAEVEAEFEAKEQRQRDELLLYGEEEDSSDSDDILIQKINSKER